MTYKTTMAADRRFGGHQMLGTEKRAAGLIIPQPARAVNLWADGLCEPVNPGGWGCWGWLAEEAGQRVAEGRGCLGHGAGMTNNRAEYQAAIEALRWAAGEGLRGVTLYSDSQLVVNQANASWACKAAHLLPLLTELRLLMAATGATVQWVPREQNQRADQLSRNAWADATRRARS
ncbi:MAG: ribonuclease HI family protein [Anaerolineae bacterium]